jgi:hypothetical protein
MFEPKGPRLIIVEGKTDEKFFLQLFTERALTGFEVTHPAKGTEGGSWSKFGWYLNALAVTEGFRDVKLVILVGDNDTSGSFENIRKQARAAGYNPPSKPFEIAKTAKKPSLAIVMLPGSPPGCLESLLLQAAYRKWPTLRAPLEQYIAQTPASGWSETKKAKTGVECLLAVTCEERPEVLLHDHWQKDPVCHIPVTDSVFDELLEFLKSPSVCEHD